MSGRGASAGERRAGRLAPGRRRGAAAREREGASRCQGTASAREQRPRPGSGSTALRLAAAGPARSEAAREASRELGPARRRHGPPPGVRRRARDARARARRGSQADLRTSCSPAARAPREGLRAPWFKPRAAQPLPGSHPLLGKGKPVPPSLAGAGDTWRGQPALPRRGPVFRRPSVLVSPSVCL